MCVTDDQSIEEQKNADYSDHFSDGEEDEVSQSSQGNEDTITDSYAADETQLSDPESETSTAESMDNQTFLFDTATDLESRNNNQTSRGGQPPP